MSFYPAKLINLWDRISNSLWFVPITCTVGGILAATIMLTVDRTLDEPWERPFWVETTIDGAQTVLSTISGGMITVAGVVLSMTMVTLSITSSQFGSRVLRSRLSDRTTQWTIGAFLGTTVYSLLVLKMVRKLGEEDQFVPHLSVMAAIAFALASLVFLLYFIHHVTMIAQAPQIVATLGQDLGGSINRIYPERLGDPPPEGMHRDDEVPQRIQEALREGLPIYSLHEGYIQAIDGDVLLEVAEKHDLVIQLPKRPGDFLALEERLATVALSHDVDNETIARQINAAFILGAHRTPRQDINCAVHELSQMAVRALSPGINDPYTAVNCIDRLSSALSQLAQRRMPSTNRYDKEGNLRIVADRQTYAGVLHAAFDQIRYEACRSVAVSQRLMEAYQRIAEHLEDRDHAERVAFQARLTLEGALEKPHHPADLQILKDQYQRLQGELARLLDGSETNSNESPSEEDPEEDGDATGEVIG